MKYRVVVETKAASENEAVAIRNAINAAHGDKARAYIEKEQASRDWRIWTFR